MSWQIAADIREMFVELIATDGTKTVYGRNVSRKDQLTSGLAEALSLLPSNFKADQASLYLKTDLERISVREKWGGHAAFLTTEGFENLLEIDDQKRNNTFGLRALKSPPLISRDSCFGVTERTNADGSIEVGIDHKEIEFVMSKLALAEVKSVALCLLHSKINPELENQLAQKLKSHGYEVFCSHQFDGNEIVRSKKASAEAFVFSGRKALLEEIAKLGFAPEKTFMKRTPADGPGESFRLKGLSGLEAALGSKDQVLTGQFLEDRIIYDFRSAQKRISWEAEVNPLFEVYIDEGALVHTGPGRIESEPGPVSFGKGIRLSVLDLMAFQGKLKVQSPLPRFKVDPARVLKQLVPLAKQLRIDPETAAQKFLNLFYERVAAEISSKIGQENLTSTRFETGGWLAPLVTSTLARKLNVRKFMVHRQSGWVTAETLLEGKSGSPDASSWGSLQFEHGAVAEGELFEL